MSYSFLDLHNTFLANGTHGQQEDFVIAWNFADELLVFWTNIIGIDKIDLGHHNYDGLVHEKGL